MFNSINFVMRLCISYFELFGLVIEHYEKFIFFFIIVSNNFKPLQIV